MIHGKETDSEKKLQYHHKYPLAQSYILFTPATCGDYCRVPTVVCPLFVQVAEVLVTFLMRLKLAVTKENFLRQALLFFVIFVAHSVFIGRFIRNLLLFYELKDSQSITETKMSYICDNRKCRSIFAWIQILESYFTFG